MQTWHSVLSSSGTASSAPRSRVASASAAAAWRRRRATSAGDAFAGLGMPRLLLMLRRADLSKLWRRGPLSRGDVGFDSG